MNLKNTGQTIAKLRKEAGLTQEALGAKLGISDKAVSKWERGIACPDVGLWEKLSILLDTDIESLIYGGGSAGTWCGVLVLEGGIDSSVIVYNKPLIHYLISQFFLASIKVIWIIGKSPEITFPGVEIRKAASLSEVNQQFIYQKYGGALVIYGNYFLYGADLTKHFKRAMSRLDAVTIVCSMRRKNEYPVSVDEEKKIRKSPNNRAVNFYHAEPFVFYPKTHQIESNFKCVLYKNNIYSELLARGIASFHVQTYDKAIEMGNYIRLMEDNTGEKIACIEETIIRRGLVECKEIKTDTDTELYLKEIFGT